MKKQKNTQNNINLYDAGFSHLMILLSILVVVAIGGIAYGVYVHENNNNQVSLSSSKTVVASTKSGTQATTATQSTLSAQSTSTTSPATTTTASTAKTSTPTTTKTTTSTSTTKPATTSSSTPSSTPAAAATPLSVLTGIITALDNGSQSASVTESNVTIPGPIGNATGRPIVFTVNGKQYFAYSQEQMPNFNQSASSLASSMALVPATVSGASLTQSHLDKSGNLVDENESAVGYSTGGN